MIDFIEDAIRRSRLELSCEPLGEDAYMCTFVSTRGRMRRRIQMQPGHGEPTPGQLLYYYAVLAQQMDEAEDITEWAEIHGKDLSAHGTVSDFNQGVADRRDLEIVLGPDTFDALLTGLAISQAIEAARPR
ncbi:hypothetical protein [Ponticaulis sp.]|uniref:hypothetical protein n=1 Tax=Ponticaulis sp. TaxID=2020902 RepID=UPI000B7514B3|nr:hypothetical protein [Ponticaulis sp.]MAI90301.1 hypothetical protein [Ponticaulis sp.]OUX99942.1 MAG: hypothetical protein CBB65_07660 [Hyphomonadaceae bacterium TMED5]|tara:strand:+ start:279686 stop:280078 length:393 start_codon:yes stop_codon:yes gene_type:complete